MKSEKMYIVWAHPRADSLTAHIVEAMQSQAAHHAIDVTTLDLYRRGFNPVLDVEDEPDWENPNKQYSPDVHQLYSELEGHDTLVVVFPLWWYSYPAMIKGYMDRVWNHGLAYGGKGFPAKKIRWVALVGGSQSGFVKYGWEKNITDFLTSCGSYLGVEDTKITFLYNTIGVEEDIADRESHYQSLFAIAREVIDETAN
ncbi:NAD(P)H oxidoreductase [Hafnia alvei]|jgi:putative NADPH-quinone reductase|uniref:NAD(P)H oxidoreductase n=1 Tax=Hafnia alvei TaxID=569 RepID=UPI0007BCAFC4|nr:NAD(P)H oxidoreductase [Hafnia alvei]ANC39908.1 hypothetical protein A6V27_05780 [Hafnia alvei]MDN6633711.1 NAD(P)H oxidoreductase [Enterobacterales bacterium]